MGWHELEPKGTIEEGIEDGRVGHGRLEHAWVGELEPEEVEKVELVSLIEEEIEEGKDEWWLKLEEELELKGDQFVFSSFEN